MPVYSEVGVEKMYVVCWPVGCWVETAQSRCGLTVQLYNLSHKYTTAHIHFELKMYILSFLKKVLSCHELQASPVTRAQRVGFVSISEGLGQVLKKVRRVQVQ